MIWEVAMDAHALWICPPWYILLGCLRVLWFLDLELTFRHVNIWKHCRSICLANLLSLMWTAGVLQRWKQSGIKSSYRKGVLSRSICLVDSFFLIYPAGVLLYTILQNQKLLLYNSGVPGIYILWRSASLNVVCRVASGRQHLTLHRSLSPRH